MAGKHRKPEKESEVVKRDREAMERLRREGLVQPRPLTDPALTEKHRRKGDNK